MDSYCFMEQEVTVRSVFFRSDHLFIGQTKPMVTCLEDSAQDFALHFDTAYLAETSLKGTGVFSSLLRKETGLKGSQVLQGTGHVPRPVSSTPFNLSRQLQKGLFLPSRTSSRAAPTCDYPSLRPSSSFSPSGRTSKTDLNRTLADFPDKLPWKSRSETRKPRSTRLSRSHNRSPDFRKSGSLTKPISTGRPRSLDKSPDFRKSGFVTRKPS